MIFTHYLIITLLVLAVSWLTETLVIKSAYRLGLFDKPNARKIHNEQIPRLGGIVFFPVVLVAVLMLKLVGLDVRQLLMLLPPALLIYLVGLADDLSGVRYRNKFLAQAVAALLMCAVGFSYNDLYGLLGFHQLPLALSWLLTMFMVVFVTNAINFIDGIDGQSSSLSVIAFVFFAWVFWKAGDVVFAAFSAMMPFVLIPFMCYNLFGHASRHSKVFMGDAGSLFLGLVLTILSVRMTQYPAILTHPSDNLFMLSLAPMLLPMIDVVHVVLYRLYIGANPFAADKSHIHHRCLATGLSQHGTLLIVLAMSVLLTLICWWTVATMDGNWALLLIIIVWCGLNWIINKSKIK